MAQGRESGDPGAPPAGGFSLVELIVVITISGILAGVIGTFIAGPIQGFFDQARRGRLVDAAQLALLQMGRDLRGSLPNSVRVNGGVLELLAVAQGDRYRAEAPGTAADLLDFGVPDSSFTTFAPLSATSPVTGSLAIYPLGWNTDADPYDPAYTVMTPSQSLTITPVTVNGNNEFRVGLASAHAFKYDSPTRRVFLVSGPVSWLCDAGALVRYDGYAVQAMPPDLATLNGLPGATRTVVAKDVQSCNFQYVAGNAQRNAVASLAVVLAAADTPNERVKLLRQVHLSNAP